jgi:hypothetical protein
MIREPTERQVAAAKRLGIAVDGKTFRVISAEIGDELDRRSDAHMQKHGLKRGMQVRYVGPRAIFPQKLVISSYGKNCYVYFKGGSSFFCRPWDILPSKPRQRPNQDAANRAPLRCVTFE